MGLIHNPKPMVVPFELKQYEPLIGPYKYYCHAHPNLRHYIHWAIHLHHYHQVILDLSR